MCIRDRAWAASLSLFEADNAAVTKEIESQTYGETNKKARDRHDAHSKHHPLEKHKKARTALHTIMRCV